MANDALIQTAAAPLWKEPKKGAERVDEALCGVSVEILESSGIYRRVRTCYGYEGWAEEPALFPPASLEAWKAAPKALVRAPMSRRNHRCKRRLYAHCRGARWSNWTPQPARANGAESFCQTGSPASFPRPPLLGHTAAWGAAARRVSAVMLSARHAPIWARLTGGAA